MEAYQILLLIVVIVVFFYVGVLLYVVSNAITFRIRIRKKREGIAIIFAEKQECLLTLYAKFDEAGVEFSPADRTVLERLRAANYAKLDYRYVKEESDAIKEAQSHILYLASVNKWAKKVEGYDDLVSTIEDLENAFRLSSAVYNADVEAFNYWLNIPFCHWACFLLGCRKQKLI